MTYHSECLASPGARGGKGTDLGSRSSESRADCAPKEQWAEFGGHCERYGLNWLLKAKFFELVVIVDDRFN